MTQCSTSKFCTLNEGRTQSAAKKILQSDYSTKVDIIGIPRKLYDITST